MHDNEPKTEISYFSLNCLFSRIERLHDYVVAVTAIHYPEATVGGQQFCHCDEEQWPCQTACAVGIRPKETK